MLLDLRPLLEEPQAQPGGGSYPVYQPTRAPRPRPEPLPRVKVRYGPATISARDFIPVRYTARTGNTTIITAATKQARCRPLTGPGHIRSAARERLAVRASQTDDTELLLLLAAAAWD